MKLMSLLFPFFFIGFSSFSQYDVLTNYQIEILDNMIPAEEGTFQIIIDPKYRPVFTNELLYFVELKRDEFNDVRIKLMPCAELYIPSREKLKSPTFIPLEFISH